MARPTRHAHMRVSGAGSTGQLAFGFAAPILPDGTLTRDPRRRKKSGITAVSANQVNGFGIRSAIRGLDLPGAAVNHAADLRRLIRKRIVELGITYSTVDSVAGLPSRYCSKLLCEPPLRNLTVPTLILLFGALGLRLASDEATVAKLRQRHDWMPRRLDGPQYMPRDVTS
jgi:hypothetical protein